MTRFDDLDRALTAYFDIEAVAPAPAGLLESAMSTTARRRPRPAWLARTRAGTIFATAPRQGETTRTLLIAAALIALLLVIVGIALFGGGRRTPPPFAEAAPVPSADASDPASPGDEGATDEALRATWVADTRGGQVAIAITSSGLNASNLILGGTFDSAVEQQEDDTLALTLLGATGGCEAGAVGHYRAMLSEARDLLTLLPLDDSCDARRAAVGRSWGRSLLGGTTEGSGFVTSMNEPFRVDLPDQPLVARTLTDMVEIGGDDGFSLMAFRNPQGFVDACSTEQERVPFTPGAAAFADFLEQNPSLVTTSREELTVGGLPAIHIVTRVRSVADGAPCEVPEEGLYIWTPKDCACHFLGGHDSLYIVDLPFDNTMLFEVSPVDENNPIEREVIDSIEIPARLPSE